MKLYKKCSINNQTRELISCNIILEMNSAGRGFVKIKAESDETFLNKVFILNVGYHESINRFFTGFVESEQIAETGTKKLYVREMVALFSNKINVSLQHTTIKEITSLLTEKHHLTFELPDADYINKKIPHFKYQGTGYGLLDNIGRSFQIDDYCYYQTPFGKIFLGSYNESGYANKNIDLNDLNKLALKTSSSDQITLPFIPKVRPGVLINNKRVRLVNLKDDELSIAFDENKQTLLEKQIAKDFPELLSGYHLPIFGRIVSINDTCNDADISTQFRPRYAVDVQLLDENFNEQDIGVLKAVPLPVTALGFEKGIFSYPDVGSIVDIGFAYGRADKPIIRNIYPINTMLPSVSEGEILIQQRKEVFYRTDAAGNITRETDQTITDNAMNYFVNVDHQINSMNSRTSTILTEDKTVVFGSYSIGAGAIMTISDGDHGIGNGGSFYHNVNGSYSLNVQKDRTVSTKKTDTLNAQEINQQAENMINLVAGGTASIQAPQVWIGSNSINVTQLMLDTLDLVKQLSEQLASHQHGNSPEPNNGSAIRSIATDTDKFSSKYSSIIK